MKYLKLMLFQLPLAYVKALWRNRRHPLHLQLWGFVALTFNLTWQMIWAFLRFFWSVIAAVLKIPMWMIGVSFVILPHVLLFLLSASVTFIKLNFSSKEK